MTGFVSSISNGEQIVFGQNADFSGNTEPSNVNGLQTDGELWIGTTALNAGSTHINVGTLVSLDGSIDVTFSTPNINIEVSGGSTTVQTLTGDDAVIVPPTSGNINVFGGTGIDTSGAGSTLTVTFDVTEVPAIPTSIDTDSGTVTPTSNNFDILGRSGSKTGGSGAVLTVRSPPYADQGGSTSVTLNSGSFSTASVTLTTPVTAGLLDGDLLEFVVTSNTLIIQLAATQIAHIGTLATSAAGTMTSTNTGDSVSLRYQASTNDWWATSVIGTWLMA